MYEKLCFSFEMLVGLLTGVNEIVKVRNSDESVFDMIFKDSTGTICFTAWGDSDYIHGIHRKMHIHLTMGKIVKKYGF